MQYGLLPVEAAISFLLILIIVYNKKHNFISAKTILYKSFVYTSFLYGFFLFLGIIILKYIGKNIFFTICWRGQAISMFTTWVLFYFYCLTTIYNIQAKTLFEIIKSKLEFKIISIGLLIFSLVAIIPKYISLFDDINQNNIEIFTRESATTILAILIVSVISLYLRIIPRRKKLSKEFIFAATTGCLTCMLTCIFHMFYHANTLLPLCFVIYAYVLYFSVENPDILLLEETRRIQNNTTGMENSVNFLTNLNDDINIPLDRVLELCDHIKNDEFENDELGKELDEIIQNSNYILENLNNIFESSKVKKENKINNKNYESKELINDIVSLLKERIGNKKVKLSLNFSPLISSKLCGDYDKIYKVYAMLISNACKNTNLGRIMLSLSSTKKDNIDVLTLKIVDTSDGLSDDEKKNIFKSGTNFSNSLNVVKKMTESLGGRFWFKSVEKIGTTFYVQIPQKILDKKPIGTELNGKTKIINNSGDYSKYRILLVDDNNANARISEKILRKYGFDVCVSKSGMDCIKRIKLEEKFDAIFMDIMMSELNGVDTLKAIKVIEDYDLPPVIALTANALSGMKEDYLNEGFDDYLAKPINKTELKRIINRYFN